MFYILNEAGTVVRTATTVLDKRTLETAGYSVVKSDLDFDIDRVDIVGFPAKTRIVQKRSKPVPTIVLTTTAEDTDGDGLPEIPADGKSKATLRVRLHDPKGTLLKKSVEVDFRTTAGAMSHRRVRTVRGMATVHLTASHDTVTAVVSASAEGFTTAHISFEMVPNEQGSTVE